MKDRHFCLFFANGVILTILDDFNITLILYLANILWKRNSMAFLRLLLVKALILNLFLFQSRISIWLFGKMQDETVGKIVGFRPLGESSAQSERLPNVEDRATSHHSVDIKRTAIYALEGVLIFYGRIPTEFRFVAPCPHRTVMSLIFLQTTPLLGIFAVLGWQTLPINK